MSQTYASVNVKTWIGFESIGEILYETSNSNPGF